MAKIRKQADPECDHCGNALDPFEDRLSCSSCGAPLPGEWEERAPRDLKARDGVQCGPRMKPQLLTTAQAAEDSGIAPYELRRYIREGRLSAHRMGRIYLIEPAELRRFARIPRVR